MKRFILIAIIGFSQLTHLSQCIQTIGETGNNMVNYAPFYGSYNYSQFGFIYNTSTLQASGINNGDAIDQLSFQFKQWTSGYNVNNQTIKIGEIAQN